MLDQPLTFQRPEVRPSTDCYHPGFIDNEGFATIAECDVVLGEPNSFDVSDTFGRPERPKNTTKGDRRASNLERT